jgi:hypothetical protein
LTIALVDSFSSNTHLLLRSLVELTTILYDSGTCTERDVVTEQRAKNHSLSGNRAGDRWRGIAHGVAVDLQVPEMGRITLVTPLLSEDYRSITK